MGLNNGFNTSILLFYAAFYWKRADVRGAGVIKAPKVCKPASINELVFLTLNEPFNIAQLHTNLPSPETIKNLFKTNALNELKEHSTQMSLNEFKRTFCTNEPIVWTFIVQNVSRLNSWGKCKQGNRHQSGISNKIYWFSSMLVRVVIDPPCAQII